MSKVYWHKPLAPDEYLGRVEKDGKVYEDRLGPDHYVGRVELENGKVYEARLGPDKYLGRVEAGSGKVYLSRFGPDKYLGRVEKDGKFYLHRRLARDDYLGKVEDMLSYAHGGGAFLLLILPLMEEAELKAVEEQESDPGEAQTGQATDPSPA